MILTFLQELNLRKLIQNINKPKCFIKNITVTIKMSALGVHILKDSTGKNTPIIRINTPYDNPILMVELFKVIDENLARQYIAKTKVDLYV